MSEWLSSIKYEIEDNKYGAYSATRVWGRALQNSFAKLKRFLVRFPQFSVTGNDNSSFEIYETAHTKTPSWLSLIPTCV